MKHEIAVELWESNEYVVIVDGIGVVGQTLSRRDADVVSQWLRTAISAIVDTGTQTAQNETMVILNSDELALIFRALCSYATNFTDQVIPQLDFVLHLRKCLLPITTRSSDPQLGFLIMHNQSEKLT